jgi:hypothetical protein
VEDVNGKRKYIEIKSQGNNTEHLYLIDAQWIIKWANFVLYSSASMPGPILNDMLFLKLEDKEPLMLGEDVIVLS